MRHRLAASLVAALALAAVGGTAGTAVARQGADDPVAHVRHGNGADDAAARAAHRRHTARHHRHATPRHAADDAAGNARHAADDAPNHG